MALDGEKLRKLRTSKGMSQEKLAILASVNKRTIQRAEQGAPIALETAAFIAEAVGATPASLRATQMELFETNKKSWNEVVLVPVNSGRRVIDALRGAFDGELTFEVEPMKDNIGPLAQLAELLEPFVPDPWEPPHERYECSQSELLEKQAEVNGLLPSLQEMGINIFLGSYTASRQVPIYDMDEGFMSHGRNAAFQPMSAAIVVVSDTSASHLMRQPDDVYAERGYDVDDQIPF